MGRTHALRDFVIASEARVFVIASEAWRSKGWSGDMDGRASLAMTPYHAMTARLVIASAAWRSIFVDTSAAQVGCCGGAQPKGVYHCRP